VNKGSEISRDQNVWDMTEFFILRGFRRIGLGMKTAREVWTRFPGKWDVRVIARNQKAMSFWGRAIDEFLGKPIEPIVLDQNGEYWNVFHLNPNTPVNTDRCVRARSLERSLQQSPRLI
jgi:hypothetical protein